MYRAFCLRPKQNPRGFEENGNGLVLFSHVLDCAAPPPGTDLLPSRILEYKHVCRHRGTWRLQPPKSSGRGSHQCSSGGFRGDAQRGIRYKKRQKNLVTSSYWSHGLLGSLPAAVHSITVNINNARWWHFSVSMVWRSWGDNVLCFCPVGDRVTESKANNKSHLSLNWSIFISLVFTQSQLQFRF